ncbi:Peroxiredoxin [Enhydrobacter aerosaccus]|uniref:Peroxiredoxin n=1 Tax=Enhydrobacter aerosaccus TaxID=225324 RepID=A0A1T4SWL6_9HYPH|nr:redoxin domain-containing protein [Enhydrobacter aerosaccus]SKA32311.1 Peroxiredoxin [Enhydrobacter aerosaccus]
MPQLTVPRRSFLVGSAALAFAPLAARAAADIGSPAPTFVGTDSNGKSWDLAQLRGKIVVLETTNHDCPYVGKQYRSGNMQALQRDAAAKGVVWLTVAASAPGEQGYVTAAEANEIVRQNKAAPAAVLLDPQSRIAHAYGATVTPHMFIISTAGILVYKGGIDSIASTNVDDVPRARQYVRLALDEVLAGKPVSDASTRPYGCSLKYAPS